MITVSAAALGYIKNQIEKNNGIGLRLSVKKTGCSGYAYLPKVIEVINADDVVHEVDAIKFFLDPTWLSFLQDISIDYVEEDKSGLKQKRLIFSGTKEAGRCGCGESFHVEG